MHIISHYKALFESTVYIVERPSAISQTNLGEKHLVLCKAGSSFFGNVYLGDWETWGNILKDSECIQLFETIEEAKIEIERAFSHFYPNGPELKWLDDKNFSITNKKRGMDLDYEIVEKKVMRHPKI